MSRAAASTLIVLVALASAVASGAAVRADAERAQPGARASAPPAAPTLKKAMWGPTSLNDGSMFPTYRDLGVGIYQIQARWDLISPTTRPVDPRDPSDPAYEWPAYLGAAISEAESYGMEVQVMIMGAPPWSNGQRSWKWAPRQPSDLGDFATAISAKFPNVNLWMIWGEPNRKPNFGPLTPVKKPTGPLNADQAVAPRLYAQLLDSAYGALKRVDPANLVIGGNTFTSSGPDDINPFQWIRYMKLPDGSRPRMDMWGHNPWGASKPDLDGPPSKRGSVSFPDLRRLAGKLDKAFPGPPIKLFLSEWGVPTGHRDEHLLYALTPRKARSWIRAGFRIARTWKRIYTLGWIHPVDTETNSTGLLDADGEPKPTYKAYKAG